MDLRFSSARMIIDECPDTGCNFSTSTLKISHRIRNPPDAGSRLEAVGTEKRMAAKETTVKSEARCNARTGGSAAA